ncbi:MAG TPA: hypothetical protein VHB97_00915, partial [Polyangia bacterium]|nr:hypothetical protein [Polyangia bacterium]
MKTTLAILAMIPFSIGCSSSETPSGNDLAMSIGGGGPDLAMTPADLVACTPNTITCAGDTLVACGADGGVPDTTQCPFGCDPTGAAPHCKQLKATQPVITGDLTVSGLTPLMLTGSYVFDTAKGGITDAAGNVVRDANGSFSPGASGEVHQGIFFRTIETNVVVWSFADLTIAAGAQVIFSGGARVAIVSQQGLHVSGIIDARGYDFGGATPSLCASSVGGPGGSSGGAATMTGGPSSTGGTGSATGGGGGGDGDVGGNGGGGAAGGMIRGTQTLS